MASVGGLLDRRETSSNSADSFDPELGKSGVGHGWHAMKQPAAAAAAHAYAVNGNVIPETAQSSIAAIFFLPSDSLDYGTAKHHIRNSQKRNFAGCADGWKNADYRKYMRKTAARARFRNLWHFVQITAGGSNTIPTRQNLNLEKLTALAWNMSPRSGGPLAKQEVLLR